MTSFVVDDIIRISKEGYTTIGRVTDMTDDAVAIFRDPQDQWFSFSEYSIEKLSELTP